MPHLSTSVWRGLEISTAGLRVQNASWVAVNLVRLIAFSVVDCYRVYFERKDICCATSVGKSAHVPTPAQRIQAKGRWAGAEAGGAASLSRTQRCPFTCRDPTLSAVFQMRLIFTHTSHFLSGSSQPLSTYATAQLFTLSVFSCVWKHGIPGENELFYDQLFTSLKHTVHLLLGSGNCSWAVHFLFIQSISVLWTQTDLKSRGKRWIF